MGKPTFAALSRFLEEQGFTKRVIPGSHVLFRHEEADTWVVLRLYRDDEPVAPVGLAAVRRTLDAWGLMEADEFDEQMRQASVAV